jgi:hypothetical protein
MGEKTNITDTLRGTIFFENDNHSLRMELTKTQLTAIKNLFGLEIFSFGKNEYDVLTMCDEELEKFNILMNKNK